MLRREWWIQLIFVPQVQQASARKEQEMSDHMETLKV